MTTFFRSSASGMLWLFFIFPLLLSFMAILFTRYIHSTSTICLDLLASSTMLSLFWRKSSPLLQLRHDRAIFLLFLLGLELCCLWWLSLWHRKLCQRLPTKKPTKPLFFIPSMYHKACHVRIACLTQKTSCFWRRHPQDFPWEDTRLSWGVHPLRLPLNAIMHFRKWDIMCTFVRIDQGTCSQSASSSQIVFTIRIFWIIQISHCFEVFGFVTFPHFAVSCGKKTKMS